MDNFLKAVITIIIAVAIFAIVVIQTQGPAAQSPRTRSPIKHVIIIFQENHAFDNYFGTYPGAYGIPNNTCVPYNLSNPNPCIKPWLDTNPVDTASEHTWNTSFVSYDYGKMDGFVFATNGSRAPMGYYNNQTIPYYWTYAKQYVLTDHLFSSALSYSLPNHWFAIAGRTPSTAFDYVITRNTPTLIKNEYLNESFRIQTIGDLLDQANVSWKYYDVPLIDFKAAVINGLAFSYWNPFAAKNISYAPAESPHFVARTKIFSDLKNNTLPSVSWVIPPYNLSEHPPANIILGMWYVTYIINSVMQSKYWNSTVIIVMWDDYGGYYDGVKPPQLDQYGLSFRVPALIISPYSKQGYVDHTIYSFGSTLKFIEWNYNIQSLTTRDGNANNMLNALDFNQTRRRPYIIPMNQSQIEQINDILYSNQNTYFSNSTKIDVNGFILPAQYFDT